METATVEEKTIDHQISILSKTISNKKEFEAAVTRLALLLSKSLNLRSSDVYGVVRNLNEMENQIVTRFTERHEGKSVSVETAQHQSEAFRLECIERVLRGEDI